ncbi:hypothetical protein CONLIGDRAFT_663706 [Coniochaeta ligniaria NRRL 30616]|uniref:Cation efflux protein n=1 Tax=Coniochaeta ligniaria NRRL 30616 TaxID=1408157 RepID=A0A1J7IBA5_9PEZI|nr:hypothetical protein CONLIGDRAFT_663706 [Coniochaeta ligniaria NRRL 30616]
MGIDTLPFVSDIELERLRKSLVSLPNTSSLANRFHRKVRRVYNYYTTQNLHINRFVMVAEDPIVARLLDGELDTSAFYVKAAVYVSIYGTILVAALQIYVAATTRSLSLFLNDITWWPAGVGRLCNAGNICFAFALMAVSLVLMLWEDNRNDCFEYGFAIFASAVGAKLKWWVDPAGAILIACVIIEIVFLTLRYSDLILKVDTVYTYHWGEELFVEVDIVMALERSLREVYDLETVEGFGRAFVHVDYETSHMPEHRKTR